MDSLIIAGLVASLGLALLGWLTGHLVELAGAGPRLRLNIWTLAFLAPVALPLAMLAIAAGEVSSPVAFTLSPAGSSPPVEVSDYAGAAGLGAPATPGADRDTKLSDRAGHASEVWIMGLALTGAMVQLARLALRLRQLSTIVAGSAPLRDDACARGLGFPPERIRIGDSPSPLLAGVIRPVIVLPRSLTHELSAEQLRLICAHELSHLRSGDHLRILAEEVLMATYWFNPVLRAIHGRLSMSREEVCDARVLSHVGENTRRAYARTLLTALQLAGRSHPVAAFIGARRQPAAKRLRAILQPTPRRPAAMAAGVCAGAFLSGTASVTALAFAGAPSPVASPVFQARPADLAPTPPRTASMEAFEALPAAATAASPAAPEEASATPAPRDPLQLASLAAPPLRAIASPEATVSDSARASLEKATSALADARRKRIELQARQAQLRSAPKDAWPEIMNNAELRSLTESLSEVDRHTSTLPQMYAPAPEWGAVFTKVAQQRRETLIARIAHVTASIEASLALDIRMAAAQEAALQQEVRRLAS